MTNNDENDLVFTTYITLKNGKRLYAKDVGKTVFCFPRTKKKNNK